MKATPFPFKLGWRREHSDQRDYIFRAEPKTIEVPFKEEFTYPWIQTPVHQGSTGSCVGNAIATVAHSALMRQRSPRAFQPSRLQIYYGARERQGWEGADTGAYIRDGMSVVANEGVCPEELWPFTSSIIERPSPEAWEAAKQYRGWLYRRLDDPFQWIHGGPTVVENVKASLLEGCPPVFGFVIYSNFDWDNGVVTLPPQGSSVYGGHAAVFTGWNDKTRMLQWQSSWGTGFANNGRGLMSYDFVNDPTMVHDVWNLSAITSPGS